MLAASRESLTEESDVGRDVKVEEGNMDTIDRSVEPRDSDLFRLGASAVSADVDRA